MPDTFAAQLINELVAADVTQGQIARVVGVDPSLITRWRQGRKQPSGRTLFRLARLHLNVMHFEDVA